MAENHTDRSHADPNLADGLKQLASRTTRLAKLELELVREELTGKAGALGRGAGLLAAAALLGLLALSVLTAAAVLALATTVAGWLAALIVFGVYLGAALGLALLGLRRLKQATPLVPARAIENLKGDLKWVEMQLR